MAEKYEVFRVCKIKAGRSDRISGFFRTFANESMKVTLQANCETIRKIMVRKANRNDVGRIIELLHQVNMVHHVIRPDLFKPYTTKYSARELEALLGDESKPVFVFDDGEVRGHAFCQVTEVKGHQLLEDVKTLYIDDICVDEASRGRHVGRALYEYVRELERLRDGE